MEAVREQFGAAIVGQRAVFGRLLTAPITGNHVLIEGVPGLASSVGMGLRPAKLHEKHVG